MSGKADILKICENHDLPVYDLCHLLQNDKRVVYLCFATGSGKQELTAPTNGRLKKKLIAYLNKERKNNE